MGPTARREMRMRAEVVFDAADVGDNTFVDGLIHYSVPPPVPGRLSTWPISKTFQPIVLLHRHHHHDRPPMLGDHHRFGAGQVDQPTEAGTPRLSRSGFSWSDPGYPVGNFGPIGLRRNSSSGARCAKRGFQVLEKEFSCSFQLTGNSSSTRGWPYGAGETRARLPMYRCAPPRPVPAAAPPCIPWRGR